MPTDFLSSSLFPCKLLSCTDRCGYFAWKKIICLWIEGLGANKIPLEHYQNLPILLGDIPYFSLFVCFNCISTSYILQLSQRIKWMSNRTSYSEIHLPPFVYFSIAFFRIITCKLFAFQQFILLYNVVALFLSADIWQDFVFLNPIYAEEEFALPDSDSLSIYKIPTLKSLKAK